LDSQTLKVVSVLLFLKIKRLNLDGKLFYTIQLFVRDIEILKQIKQFFNVGTISYNLDKTNVIFRVRSLNDLSIIIKFFQQFSLLTSKRHNLIYLFYYMELFADKNI